MRQWYRTFFNDTALDIWQRSRTDEMTAAEATFLAGELGCEAPARVLDIACGNGRHGVLLAAAGFAVTGVDISEGNRERVRARAEAQGVEMELVVGDMLELDFESRFAAAYLWGNSLGYFPRDGMRRLFAGVARALLPGGRLIIDTATAAESILVELDRQTWTAIDDDTRVMFSSSYDPLESRLDTIYTTLVGNAVVDESTAHIWIFTSGELVDMARAANLDVVALHGDLDGSPFELGDERLVLVFEKPSS